MFSGFDNHLSTLSQNNILYSNIVHKRVYLMVIYLKAIPIPCQGDVLASMILFFSSLTIYGTGWLFFFALENLKIIDVKVVLFVHITSTEYHSGVIKVHKGHNQCPSKWWKNQLIKITFVPNNNNFLVFNATFWLSDW